VSDAAHCGAEVDINLAGLGGNQLGWGEKPATTIEEASGTRQMSREREA
jgi:hypothetical protein